MAHPHPYAIQAAAMCLAAIPTVAVLGLVAGAQFEQARRNPAPKVETRPSITHAVTESPNVA